MVFLPKFPHSKTLTSRFCNSSKGPNDIGWADSAIRLSVLSENTIYKPRSILELAIHRFAGNGPRQTTYLTRIYFKDNYKCARIDSFYNVKQKMINWIDNYQTFSVKINFFNWLVSKKCLSLSVSEIRIWFRSAISVYKFGLKVSQTSSINKIKLAANAQNCSRSSIFCHMVKYLLF